MKFSLKIGWFDKYQSLCDTVQSSLTHDLEIKDESTALRAAADVCYEIRWYKSQTLIATLLCDGRSLARLRRVGGGVVEVSDCVIAGLPASFTLVRNGRVHQKAQT